MNLNWITLIPTYMWFENSCFYEVSDDSVTYFDDGNRYSDSVSERFQCSKQVCDCCLGKWVQGPMLPFTNFLPYFTRLNRLVIKYLRITGKSTEVYNLYVLKKSVKTSVNVFNIGPRV
jgi:hypothetical protein